MLLLSKEYNIYNKQQTYSTNEHWAVGHYNVVFLEPTT